MTDWDCVAVIVTCGEFDRVMEFSDARSCDWFCEGYESAVNDFGGDGHATRLSWYEPNEGDTNSEYRDERLAKYGWSLGNG